MDRTDNDTTTEQTALVANHHPQIEWSTEHEKILIDWADKAICYRWLHSKSHNNYSALNTWFTIPVIIMSTVTGTANFAQDRVPPQYVGAFTMIIGAINLFAGILTTIQQFLKISELNESHRVSSIAWGKFSRNIKVDLAKSPQERTPVSQILKYSKEEFDRLIETSPTLSDKVISLFMLTFSGGEVKPSAIGTNMTLTPKQIAFAELNKPEICDSIESIYKTVYKQKTDEHCSNIYLADCTKVLNERKKKKIIEDFILNFELEKKRQPTTDEIINNLESLIPVNIIQSIVSEFHVIKQENHNNISIV